MEVSISTIMRSKLLTLHPKDNVSSAISIFKTHALHHIPVVVMNQIRGIVSKGDILFLRGIMENAYDDIFIDNRLETMKIEDIMSSNPVCINENESIRKACKLMTDHRINALPILRNDELCGLVTTYDILIYVQNLN